MLQFSLILRQTAPHRPFPLTSGLLSVKLLIITGLVQNLRLGYVAVNTPSQG